jgi:hypothetical protein
MTDPREIFVSRVDVSKTRVKSFSGFIILCGGPHKADSTSNTSARNRFWKHLTQGRHQELCKRLKLAEEITDWYKDGKYKDLLTFEEHLASLASVILLFVESAGAIAELGAFSVLDGVSKRVLAVVPDMYYEQDSFIRLGPLARLENNTDESVLVFPWHERDDLARFRENLDLLTVVELNAIIEGIETFATNPEADRIFKVREPMHVMLLMCELCDLFGALTESELISYVQKIAPSLERKEGEQFVFLLHKCDLLRIKARSNGRYYVAPDWSTHIRFSYFDGERVDRERTRIDVIEYYRENLKSRVPVLTSGRS